jgi:hypothetical protein
LGPIEKHKFLDDIICINFYTTRFPDKPRTLVFDQSQTELAEKVLKFAEDKLSLQISKNLKPIIKLNRSQHIFMMILSVLGALLFVYFIMPAIALINNDYEPLIFIISVFILGPGTWGMLLLKNVNLLKYRNWSGLMYIYNFLTFFLIMLIVIISEIMEFSNFFKSVG